MKKNDLFSLLKSLSKSEKRHFRIFCSRSGSDPNYLRLFDVMDALEVYDERVVREKLAGEPFLRQLHVTKNYLRQMILKSLRDYHTGLSKDAELKDCLRNVEILFHRELYDLCGEELGRAEKMAATYGLNIGLAEVCNWQRKLAQTLAPNDFDRFEDAVGRQGNALRLQENTLQFWQLAIRFSRSFIGDGAGRPVDAGLLAAPENARTLEAKVLYYNTLYLVRLRNGNEEEAETALLELIGLLEGHPQRLFADPGAYISTVNNLVSFQVYRKSYDKALDQLSRARGVFQRLEIPGEHKSLLKQLLRAYNIELEICRVSGAWRERPDFILDTGRFVDRYRNKMPQSYLESFYFQLAYIRFMRKEYDDSLRWINQLLNLKAAQIERTDLQAHARMLNLMVHFEQQNWFVMRYFTDSVRRWLRKSGRVEPYQQALLQFFSRIGNIPEYEFKDRFRELAGILFPPGAESLVPAGALEMVDYRAWISARY